MAFRFKRKQTVAENARRIAGEQLDKCLAELEDPQDPDEAVHEVRKRLKKLRALLRLLRDALGETVYQAENARLRDAARRVGEVRDSLVLVETLDGLLRDHGQYLKAGTFGGLREALVEEHRQIREVVLDRRRALSAVAVDLRGARSRVAHWSLDGKGFKALAPGLARVYGRGRKAMDKAYAKPRVETFHDWRKRVKYLRYQLRLLRKLWPGLLDPQRDLLHELSDLLGDDHDLAVLRRRVARQPEWCGDGHDALLALIDQRRRRLQAQAQPLGRRLYAEAPKAFVRRVHGYWNVWY